MQLKAIESEADEAAEKIERLKATEGEVEGG